MAGSGIIHVLDNRKTLSVGITGLCQGKLGLFDLRLVIIRGKITNVVAGGTKFFAVFVGKTVADYRFRRNDRTLKNRIDNISTVNGKRQGFPDVNVVTKGAFRELKEI